VTSSGAYRLYIAQSLDFSDAIVTTVFNTFWIPEPPLEYDTYYYWRVIPFNLAGDAIGHHLVWSFMTEEATSEYDEISAYFTNSLLGNFPNPFNPETSIRFQVAGDRRQEYVTIEVFNIRGQKVRGLLSEIIEAGYHAVVWDGRDHSGVSVGSGIYFYRMTISDFVETRRMVLLR
jgi:hypothetical protein